MADRKATVVVRADSVTKTFRIPTQASSGIKQKIINLFKGIKGYREFTPLRDVSFEVRKGDFFGIVGRNGSGKSTLLKIISGIYNPTSGSVEIDGSLVPFIELGVGFNPELSGRENVYLNGALLGFSHDEVTAMYEDIVDFAEIGDFMEEKLKNYSSGMQVRLAFSIAIKAEGDILILDEVLAVGDAAFQQKCYDYFEKLKDDKKTVILVTHDMASVQRFCNRALILDKGEMKLIGDPQEVADLYREENIRQEPAKEHPSDNTRSSEHGDKLYISYQENEKSIDFLFELKHTINEDVYVGLSFITGGQVFAELNSRSAQLKGNKITYSLDTKIFNPGVYEISAALFKRKNEEVIAISNRPQFTIKGSDRTRGSAMKLPNSWVE